MPNHEHFQLPSEKEKDEAVFYKINSQIEILIKQRYSNRAIKNEKILYI
jgi:hypothetical protein|tara:strand:- start:21 stop:167 length:147 start_codon:yes stop_codon:yes gene_type:complete